MRQNPNVCLQTDELRDRSSWISVIVNGTYRELGSAQNTMERGHARARLAKVSDWWRTPLAERREHSSDLSIEPIFFCIDISSMTGLRRIPEPS
jgi:nitroimidazol reductase NimA-like FMN-containing flavoprotein (pyridoxamine 5'-phosphate oxidase superfamily)